MDCGTKETDAYLGWCGLKFLDDLQETDIGYRFHKKYWGRGYATESAAACLKYGFEKLNLKKIIGRAMKKMLPQ
jgi:RimJ/RimL family protein N-acetyltransferase